MEYIIKKTVNNQEELVYTRAHDELEQEYYELYLEEKGIDDESEYEDKGGDIDELWDLFYVSALYKECLEIVNGEEN